VAMVEAVWVLDRAYKCHRSSESAFFEFQTKNR
jgi:hypothetical protein